jgi:hypothetical protein
MLKKSYSGMKKVLAISLAVLFVVSFTAVAASAEREGHPGHPGHGGFDFGGCGGCGGYGWGGGGYGYGYVAIHVSSSRIVGIYGVPAPTCLSGHVNKKDL